MRLFRRRAKGNCRDGSPISCAGRAAPRLRAPGASGPHVRLGSGEAQVGGARKTAILADVCESLIGAIFLDAGYSAARDVVRAPGTNACWRRAGRCRTPRPRCRNGRRRAGARRLSIARPAAAAPTIRRNSSSASKSTDLSPPKATGARSARPNRRLRKPSCRARAPGRPAAQNRGDADMTDAIDDTLRLRRPDRCAERRQIDAPQCAGRRQSVDRVPQGADDAQPGARHCA